MMWACGREGAMKLALKLAISITAILTYYTSFS